MIKLIKMFFDSHLFGDTMPALWFVLGLILAAIAGSYVESNQYGLATFNALMSISMFITAAMSKLESVIEGKK